MLIFQNTKEAGEECKNQQQGVDTTLGVLIRDTKILSK